MRFNEHPLRPEILDALNYLKYTSMTDIQEASVPSILNNQDVLAQASTGSGKTCCFALGILQSVSLGYGHLEGLVLCPTRELADQVSGELRRIASALPNVKVLTIYGGVPIFPQIRSLRHGANVVVGTPGRIWDLMGKGALDLSSVKVSVLDEADRMLDMGFIESISSIFDQVPKNSQKLLFSATYTPSIRDLAESLLKDPVLVKVAQENNSKRISQNFSLCAPKDKLSLLQSLLLVEQPECCAVFCNTIEACERVQQALSEKGFAALSLHGKMDQKQRTEALLAFANGSFNVIVVTDVASRGLDIKGLNLVINYDMTRDPEVYVHRIGRTGRHENDGKSWTFVTGSEAYKIENIEKLLNIKCPYTNITHPPAQSSPRMPMYRTLQINQGKKAKIRPGDILGALTSGHELAASMIGKIDVLPYESYIAIQLNQAQKAKSKLDGSRIKKLRVKARWLKIP